MMDLGSNVRKRRSALCKICKKEEESFDHVIKCLSFQERIRDCFVELPEENESAIVEFLLKLQGYLNMSSEDDVETSESREETDRVATRRTH